MIQVATSGTLVLYSCCNDDCEDNAEMFVLHENQFVRYDVILKAFREIVKDE